MQIIRYQHADAIHTGHLDGEALGPINGDVFGKFSRGRRTLKRDEVKLLAPCLPSKIVGVTNNFADRAREAGLPVPTAPLLFIKPSTAVIGPGEPIVLPPQSQQVEYSAELAVVIGKPARWVAPDDAAGYILGYTCANDLAARDILEAEGLWTRAKSFDTFCPIGPAINTQLNPAELLITCKVNGQTRQMTSTHDMLFAPAQIVSFVSSVMTLLPGDVILTGTPAGAGLLNDGDVVEVEIEGIGRLANPVTAGA